MVLAAHNAGGHIGRAVESVLNQTFPDLELIVADCASQDRTRSMCERFAERDIRVETLCVQSESCLCGRRAALEAARGSYVLFLNQNDWLSPTFLDVVVSAARADDAALVIPELSVDTDQSDGARVSSTLSHESCFWGTPDAFRRGSSLLIENGVLAFAGGKLMSRGLLDSLPDRVFDEEDEQAFMVECVRDVDRVAVVEGARYHFSLVQSRSRVPYDPDMFERCERDHEAVLELYRSWGMDGDDEIRAAICRRHLRGVIRCIENASIGGSHIAAAERRARVQRIVDAPSTRTCVEVLRPQSHEFGIMYAPIARRSAAACCMGARVQEVVGRALLPFAPTAPARV